MEKKDLSSYKIWLMEEEKSKNTIDKYMHDVSDFLDFVGNKKITKVLVLQYKEKLLKSFAPRSVNAYISSVNSYLTFIDKVECRVKLEKLQQKRFRDVDKELTKEEYIKLIETAEVKNRHQLALIIQTLGSTGLRVSELQYLTVDSIKNKKLTVRLKGKVREVYLTDKLCEKLNEYIKSENIIKGPVFLTSQHNIITRNGLWKRLRNLARIAGIDESKVFPHNFRHLFAVVFYDNTKDIVHLSDLLGHSSVDTTRIYTEMSLDSLKSDLNDLNLVP